MNLAPFIIILFVLNLLLLLIIAYLLLKIKELSKKVINVSYDDVKLITENLKDLIVESEKVSEKLESSIKEKEAVLEDLVDLIDAKLRRLEHINVSGGYNQIADLDKVEDTAVIRTTTIADADLSGMSLREKVVYLSKNGVTPMEIAKRLGISVTEVNLVLKHGR
ncbi:MAG: hypothetical protein N3C60_00530 [Calditerrivibrio sp.]|nr:hypothetical protein [Calditerrivibrio sp.]